MIGWLNEECMANIFWRTGNVIGWVDVHENPEHLRGKNVSVFGNTASKMQCKDFDTKVYLQHLGPPNLAPRP